MNNFKNSIDKIEMNDNDKRRVLNNILSHKKKSFTFTTFAYRFAVFLLVFTLAFGSVYALVKVFKLDDKVVEFFDLDDKTREQIEVNGRDIDIVNHYDNYDINFKQVIIGKNKINFIFDMENIKNNASLNTIILVKGNIDESKISIDTYENGELFDVTYTDSNGGSYGFGMIDDNDNKLSYVADYYTYDGITTGTYTIRFYDNNQEYHDVKFDINNTDIRTINYDKKDILYNKNNIIVTNDKMIITNSDIYVEATCNNLEALNNLEYDIMNFSESSLKMKDGSIVKLAGSAIIENDKVILSFEYENSFINIDNVESIVINNIEIKISD